MRVEWLLLAIALQAGLAPADRPSRRHSAALEALTVEADHVGAEFSADMLIRVAQAAATTDPAWSRELLERAFVRAYAAQQPYRRIAAPMPSDSRQHAEALAADTPLDTLSLQLRVVHLLRMWDPRRARELFTWVYPDLEDDTCESGLVPAIDEYYQALATLTRETFPRTAAGRADAFQFFELYLWRAHLASEMPAVAKAIGRLSRTRDDAAYLESVARVILLGSDRDPRGLSTTGLDVIAKLDELENADRHLGVTGSRLSHALRQYLVKQLTDARCGDSVVEGALVTGFNTMVRRRSALDDGVELLEASETRASKILQSLTLDPLWQTFDARRLHNAWIDLRGTGARPAPLSVRLTSDWRERADRHLANLDNWLSTSEPNARDYFYEKGALFIGLVDLVPPGDLRVRVLRSFAEFLHHSDANVSRQLWFAVATRLIELASGPDAPDVRRILEGSGDPVLTMYVHAARTLSAGRRPTTTDR